MAVLSPDQVAGNGSAIAPRYEPAFEGPSAPFAEHALRAQSRDGVPTLSVEASMGLGRA